MLLKWTCTRSKPRQFWPVFFSFAIIYPYTQTQKAHTAFQRKQDRTLPSHTSNKHASTAGLPPFRWASLCPAPTSSRLYCTVVCIHLIGFIRFNSWAQPTLTQFSLCQALRYALEMQKCLLLSTNLRSGESLKVLHRRSLNSRQPGAE